jgi:hypothetical protein
MVLPILSQSASAACSNLSNLFDASLENACEIRSQTPCLPFERDSISWNGVWTWISIKFEGWFRRDSRRPGRWSWISKATSRLASKTFERLKRALKLDLEGTLEAGFEEIPEAGMGCGFGSGRQSQGWLRRLTLPQALCGKFQPMSAEMPVEWPPTIMPKGHEAALVSVPLGGTIFNGGCLDTRSAYGRIAGPIPVPRVA